MNKKIDPQVQYFCKHQVGIAGTEVVPSADGSPSAKIAVFHGELDAEAQATVAGFNPTLQMEEVFVANLTASQIERLAETAWVTRILTFLAARTEAACGGPMMSLTLEALEMLYPPR